MDFISFSKAIFKFFPVMQRPEKRFVIGTKDLMSFYGGSYEVNRRRLRRVKDALKLKVITFQQYANYEGIDYATLCEICSVKAI